MMTLRRLRHALLIPLFVLLVSACDSGNGAPTSALPAPSLTFAPPSTAVPAPDTAIPPTDTAVPPTDTAVPPTATVAPPTATVVPPTATRVAPSPTAVVPTATAVPPSAIPLPPTDAPAPPTVTRLPPTATALLPTPAATRPPLPTATARPPLPTATARPPTATPLPQAVAPPTAPPTVLPPTGPPVATPAPAADGLPTQPPGTHYNAYIPAALKQHQVAHFTCEFDAAWVVLATYGISATTEDLIPLVGIDTSVEPTWEETAAGVIIHGGDVTQYYSGDYATNFLARSTGQAVRKIFDHYGLRVTPVHTQATIQAALRRGELVWIKTTADFKAGRPALWIMPNGDSYHTVLGNDHAAVVMGYNSQVAVIRDVLGPTSTNATRAYEYEVPWPRFLQMWASQANDGLAVAPPK